MSTKHIGTEKWTAEQAREHFKKHPHQPANKSKQGDKAKAEIELMLKLFGKPFEKEVIFHPERKWRFDFSIPSLMVAIEYEGIFSDKSRHTTNTGFMQDCLKYREAAKLGWLVLRYTNKDYKQMSSDLHQILNGAEALRTDFL